VVREGGKAEEHETFVEPPCEQDAEYPGPARVSCAFVDTWTIVSAVAVNAIDANASTQITNLEEGFNIRVRSFEFWTSSQDAVLPSGPA
jgi:hypothetical protein